MARSWPTHPNSRKESTTMRKTTTGILCGAVLFGLAATAQTPPDFSGVYYPINPFGAAGGAGAAKGKQKGPPARPTRPAPRSDGSQGRSPDAPSLTPEYMAKWQFISKSRIAGSYEYDNTAKCLPPGMPAMMNMAYGMEIMQTKDKI